MAPLMGMSRSRKPYDRKVVVSEICHRDHVLQLIMTDEWRRYSVRTDGEKYMSSEKNQTEELYNLRLDPGEQNNIATDNQPNVARYRALLKSRLESVNAGREASSPSKLRVVPFNENDRRRLRALGYI